MTTRMTTLVIALLSTLLIASCGEEKAGGSTSGFKDSAMTVDESNKNTAARSSAAGANKAIESKAAPGRSLGSQGMQAWLQLHQQALGDGRRSTQRATTVDLSDSVCPEGGSAVYEVDSNNSGSSTTVTVVYTNCTSIWDGYTTVINGTADWTFSENDGFTYVYDLTTTTNDDSWTITGTYSCDAEYTCSYTEDFSANGVDYRLENVEVSGNNSSGYDVSFRVTHEELGYVDVSGEDLVICDDGGFESGTITVTDGSNATVLSMSFVSCTQMTVTFNGNAETVAQ